jgi:hypothetical protein
MVFARLRGKSAAIIDCCTPRPLLSFAAEPVINDNACRHDPYHAIFPRLIPPVDPACYRGTLGLASATVA